MANYVGPKCKICRREGAKLYLKGARCHSIKCIIERKGGVPPGERPKKKIAKQSDFALRLREKQRLKRTYGVLERQFRRYLRDAEKSDIDLELALMRKLESRLDNVVRALGFCQSVSRARQLVKHGHVMVDGKIVDIPSYNVKQRQVITLTPEILKSTAVKKSLETISSDDIPFWLAREGPVGKIIRLPETEDISSDFDIGLIVEYYSR